MDEEVPFTGRRTRRSAKLAPVAKVEKPATRKTRKKVVLMEVEVSDDEEDTPLLNEKALVEKENNSDIAEEADDTDRIKSEKKSEDTEIKNGSNAADTQEISSETIEKDIKTEIPEKDECAEENDKPATKPAAKIIIESDIKIELDKKIEADIKIEPEESKDEVNNSATKNGNAEIKLEQMEEDSIVEKENLKIDTVVREEESMDTDENILDQIPTPDDNAMKIKNEVESMIEDEISDSSKTENDKKEKDIIDNKEKDAVITKKLDTENKKAKSSTDIKDADNKDEEMNEEDDKKNTTTVDPDAENISEDELPGVPVVKVPEAEEVSDEELPEPKRAELPADTEVVSEDELPTVKSDKKETKKRKLDQADYDPGSPTSESETPVKKAATEAAVESINNREKEKSPKPKKLPELDKYWKAVNDDPTDFTGWTYLLQYVDQENDMEAAREAYDAFLSHYPYCYGYWRKYADYEKRKGNKKKCEEVFERGLKAIPLSVDLWLHYLTYVKTTKSEDEDYIRSQFDRALGACGLEFRSDRLWDSYIKWETDGKRLQRVTAIYDKLFSTPTQGYTTHFDNFQEHVASNPPNKIIEVDEFLALRKEVRTMLKHDSSTTAAASTTDPASSSSTADDDDNNKKKDQSDADAPPGDEEPSGGSKMTSTDEETKAIRERIVSIRRKAHKTTVNAVTSRWNYEEGIKRPYFHVKPLERCQLKNWNDYLDYETEQGDRTRIIVLFERCLIACALYEEFWLKFVHYLESLKDPELQTKIRDVYERACTIHHLKKPNLHLQWAMFEESIGNVTRAAEILVNLEKSVQNVLQIAYRRINLERRRSDFEKCTSLFEHYITNSKNKIISSNIAIKYSRFCYKIMADFTKAQEVLKSAITKDPNNPRLYLQLIDLILQNNQNSNNHQTEIIEIIDSFLDKDTTDTEQKVLFAQRKLEYLEDFGSDIQSVQSAYEAYQKFVKLNKETVKKKEVKTDTTATNKKDKNTPQPPTQTNSYAGYGAYGNTAQTAYPYSGAQQGQYNYSQYGQGGEQYQYQNWQYPQGGYSGYNQWGGYSGGYGY